MKLSKSKMALAISLMLFCLTNILWAGEQSVRVFYSSCKMDGEFQMQVRAENISTEDTLVGTFLVITPNVQLYSNRSDVVTILPGESFHFELRGTVSRETAYSPELITEVIWNGEGEKPMTVSEVINMSIQSEGE